MPGPLNRKQRRAAKAGKPSAVSFDERFAEALAHHQAGRLEAAETGYRACLALDPGEPATLHHLGIALQQSGRLEEAVAAWRAALIRAPDLAEAHYNAGLALRQLERAAEAEAAWRAALGLRPDYVRALNNIGLVQCEQSRVEEGIASLSAALRLAPDLPETHYNLGNALQQAGRLEEAVAAWRASIALRADYADAHKNLGLVLLLLGRFEEGWREYEWRWKGGSRILRPRGFRQPPWRGEPLAGRTLLLHGEQGFGDMLQFARFTALVAAQGGKAVLEVPAALIRLFETLPDRPALVAAGAPLPDFDLHLPLMSVPGVLGTTLADIPAEIPYLSATEADLAARRLPERAGLRVGLVWAGEPRLHDPEANAVDRRRSMSLAQLAPLLDLPGCTFVSLQKGAAATELGGLPEASRPFDPMGDVADFADTAALVAQLDLVIGVDTSVIHLAGAMGKPVWMLSRFDGCWRWLQDRDDSPWYPTLHLFRQTEPGDWAAVVRRVREALAGFIGAEGS